MINRYYSRTPYEGELFSPNVGMVAQVLESAQKQYDVNFLEAEDIKNKTIAALTPDRARADEIQSGYQSRIDEIVSKYSGDYSQATKDLYSLKRDITRDFSPGGEAAAIEQNYKTYYDRLNEERKRLDKKEIVADQIKLWSDYTLGNYQGIGKKDPVTASYNILSPESIAEFVDPNAIIEDTFKATPELERETGQEVFQNGMKIYTKNKIKGKTYDQLKPAFTAALLNNEKYMNFIRQKYRFTGDAGNEGNLARKNAFQLGDTWARLKQYQNVSDDQRVDRDPLYLQNLRHQQAMDRIRYNRALQKADEDERRSMPIRIGETIQTPNGEKLPTNWNTAGAQTEAEMGAFGKLVNTVGSWFGDVLGSAVDQIALPGIVNAPRTDVGNWFRTNPNRQISPRTNLYSAQEAGDLTIMFPNINQGVLVSTFGKIAREKGKDWDKMTKQEKATFASIHDKEILSTYNADLDDLAVGITDEFAIPEKAGNVLKQQLLPLVASGGSTVFQIKDGKITEFSKLEHAVSKDDIFDDNGKIKEGVKVSSYVVPGQGFPKAAYKVTTPSGKSFYVTDQDKTRFTGFSDFAESHKPLLERGEQLGTPFSHLRVGDQQISVVPKLNYTYEGSKIKKEIEYYYIDPKTKEMKLLPNMKGDGKATVYDMWDMMNSQIRSALPVGASKSDFTKFGYDYNIEDED